MKTCQCGGEIIVITYNKIKATAHMCKRCKNITYDNVTTDDIPIMEEQINQIHLERHNDNLLHSR